MQIIPRTFLLSEQPIFTTPLPSLLLTFSSNLGNMFAVILHSDEKIFFNISRNNTLLEVSLHFPPTTRNRGTKSGSLTVDL